MIDAEIKERIQLELDKVEREENVRIFYACESGSRAWGFASTDSDYDVRFLYIRHTPWYLAVGKKRDVIEKPIEDDLDIVGWDLPKALGLFRKSNPPLLEWLGSPIKYREIGTGAKCLRELLPKFYSPRSCSYHYLHMARGNNREYLQGDEVWLKKYFYVLRPVLACMWIEQDLGPVPTEFKVLLDQLVTERDLRQSIDALLEKKLQGHELAQGPRSPSISDFLAEQLERLSAAVQSKVEPWDAAILDNLFRDLLIEYNGPGL